MADRVLELVLQLKDEMSGALKGASGAISSLEPEFKAMAVWGTAAFGAITAGVALSVSAAADAQAKMASFNATMATMKGVTADIKSQLISTSNTVLQFGFDNEDAAISLGKFYQRTGDVNDAQKLLQVTMDLSRAKHIDLATATNLVNLALSGSGRALLQYGIIIKDAATPLEALGILQSKVGGQAQAFADTFAGKMQVMKTMTEELREAIGNAFLPVLTDLLSRIIPIITAFEKWTSANPELTRNIILVGLAVSGVVAGIGTLGLIIPPVLAGMAALNISMAGLPIVIGLVVVGAYELYKNWGLVMDYLKQIDVISMVNVAIADLKIAIDDVILGVQGLITVATQMYDYFNANILPVLMALWQMMVDFVSPIFNKLWQDISMQLWPALKQLWTTISTQLMPSLKQLWDAAQPLVIVFGAALYGAFVAIVAILGILIDTVVVVLTGLTQLVTFITTVASVAINAFAAALNGIVNAFKAIVEWGQKAAQYIGGGVSSAFSSVGKAIGVKDAVITPGGQVIQTDPADYLIATKTPGSLAGGGITVIVNGDVSGEELIEKVKEGIMKQISFNTRFAV